MRQKAPHPSASPFWIFKVKPELKAALKTALVIIGVFILMNILMRAFHFDQKLINLQGTVLDFTKNPVNKILIVLGIIVFNAISAFIGFSVSKKKNCDANTWSIVCFFTSIWGLIFLTFLPAKEAPETQTQE
ncbi:MAG: hypothetical protein AB1427_07960 [Thermodesulfobacteriota bacterium]